MAKTAGQQRFIAIALLAWNAMGVAMWALQISANPEQLAQGDKVQMEVWEAMPIWAWAAYAIATWSGLAGAVALLMQKQAAVWLFAASTLGVVVQFSYALVLSPLVAVKGADVIAFPALIFIVALGSTAYAQATGRRDHIA